MSTTLSFNPDSTTLRFTPGQHMDVGFLLFTRDSLNRKVPYDLTGYTYTLECKDPAGASISPALTVTSADPTSGQVNLTVSSTVSAALPDDSTFKLWAVVSGERYLIATGSFDAQ